MANQSSTPFDQGLFLVHLNRGREHFDARNFADAAEELEEARKLRPGDDSVLNLLGLAYFKQEKYREADSVYRKLIELNPESPTLFFNLGLVCFKLSDLDRAEATFLRALELKPENQKAHFYLGNIYEKKKQYYNAIFQYRKAGANIMVKRVQEKIDRERPQERGDGEDFALPTPAPTAMPVMPARSMPSMPSPPPSMDDTRPRIFTAAKAEITAPPFPPVKEVELDRVNVDTIDRRRILSAIEQGLFRDPRPKTEPAPPPSPPPLEPSLEELVGRAVTPPDTQETVLSEEERSVIAEEARAIEPDTPTMTLPPSLAKPSVGADTTRLRLSEPLVQDESLAEMARRKEPSNASTELFFRQPERGRPAIISPVESLSAGEMADRRSQAQGVPWGGSQQPTAAEPHVYARGRRRDDLFRYLEENLLEVNFSGKVFIKQGTIYSYSGNLTFWVKPQRHEGAPPLVIVSGTGKLLLTDRRREITVLAIEDDEIYVEPSHLLACQETLTPRYGMIDREGGKSAFHVLSIQGTGMIALSVASSPLVLPVQKLYPVNVSTASVISWSGKLTPTLVEDEALAELMLPGSRTGMNLRLEGEGRVMMEKAAI